MENIHFLFARDRCVQKGNASPAGLRQGSLAMGGCELPLVKLITAAFAHDRCVQKGRASTAGFRSGSPFDKLIRSFRRRPTSMSAGLLQPLFQRPFYLLALCSRQVSSN